MAGKDVFAQFFYRAVLRVRPASDILFPHPSIRAYTQNEAERKGGSKMRGEKEEGPEEMQHRLVRSDDRRTMQVLLCCPPLLLFGGMGGEAASRWIRTVVRLDCAGDGLAPSCDLAKFVGRGSE